MSAEPGQLHPRRSEANAHQSPTNWCGPGEVLVSGTVRDLVVGSELSFVDLGEHDLNGVPDRWHILQLVR